LAEPLDACTELTNKVEQLPNASSPFALVVRGGCSFEEKVRRAQQAGFKAVIVYDNEDGGVLVASTDGFLHLVTFYILLFIVLFQHAFAIKPIFSPIPKIL